MADEPNPNIDDDQAIDNQVDDASDAPADGPDEDAEDEEIPSFGDTSDEEQDTENATIRHLRGRLKEVQKKLAETERAAPSAQTVELGPKPTFWDDEIGGDEDKYDAAMDIWRQRKADADKRTQTQTQTVEEQRQQLQARLTKVEREKAALSRPDKDDAFDTVRAALGDAKFAGIAQLLDEDTDSGKFFYALSTNPKALEALAGQADGISLVKQVTKLEGQLTMTKRRKVIDPDKAERGSGKVSQQSGDKKLEKLRDEAGKSGDYSKVAAYRAEQAKASKGR